MRLQGFKYHRQLLAPRIIINFTVAPVCASSSGTEPKHIVDILRKIKASRRLGRSPSARIPPMNLSGRAAVAPATPAEAMSAVPPVMMAQPVQHPRTIGQSVNLQSDPLVQGSPMPFPTVQGVSESTYSHLHTQARPPSHPGPMIFGFGNRNLLSIYNSMPTPQTFPGRWKHRQGLQNAVPRQSPPPGNQKRHKDMVNSYRIRKTPGRRTMFTAISLQTSSVAS